MESMNDAEKTLIHISHLHPLKLVASPEPRPVCLACHDQCGEQCYGCTECRYFLHITCATAKKYLDHPAHPAHTLTFELTPPSGVFQCDICRQEGRTFGYRCQECDYDLHLLCAALPHIVNHQSHCHPLFMVCANPNPNNGRAYCELCRGGVNVSKCYYRCGSCNFGGHITCFAPEAVKEFLPVVPATPPIAQPPQLVGDQTQSGNAATAINYLQMQEQARMQSVMALNAQIQTQQLMSAQARMGQSLMFTNANLHSMWTPNYDLLKDSI